MCYLGVLLKCRFGYAFPTCFPVSRCYWFSDPMSPWVAKLHSTHVFSKKYLPLFIVASSSGIFLESIRLVFTTFCLQWNNLCLNLWRVKHQTPTQLLNESYVLTPFKTYWIGISVSSVLKSVSVKYSNSFFQCTPMFEIQDIKGTFHMR